MKPTANALTFTGFGNTIKATANTSVNAWDDLSPNFGGLGVGTSPTSGDTDDNINGNNVLTLTFGTKVTLLGVATLFNSGHSPFGNGDPSSSTSYFLLSVNGGSYMDITFANANEELLSLTGTTFAFADGGCNSNYTWCSQPTFYVSGLEFQNTPIPAALPLFASGLGVMGLLLRRRKRKSALAS